MPRTRWRTWRQRIPPLIELPKLLSAAEHVMEEKETEEELRMLFAPGSSLGGARPKASVREKDGHLAIAKFPRKEDEINTVVPTSPVLWREYLRRLL
jgi:serine/threonine-protein kinase HipA